MLFIGPNAEKRFGSKHFADLTAVFCAPPEFTVMHGRHEIGRIDSSILLSEHREGPASSCCRGALGIRSTSTGSAGSATSNELQQRVTPSGVLSVCPQASPLNWCSRSGRYSSVQPTGEAHSPCRDALAKSREKHADHVDSAHLVVRRSGSELRWWTWAGYRANLTLHAALGHSSREPTASPTPASVSAPSTLQPRSPRQSRKLVWLRRSLIRKRSKASNSPMYFLRS